MSHRRSSFHWCALVLGMHNWDRCAGAGVACSSMASKDFMKRFASIPVTTTAGGYNPLLQDFSNTSFFVGQTS